MKLKLGKGKTNRQRKPADWEKHRVWVNDLYEEGGDEEHEKPAIDVTNVNRDVLNAGLVTIALRMAGSATPACGYLDYPDCDALAVELQRADSSIAERRVVLQRTIDGA